MTPVGKLIRGSFGLLIVGLAWHFKIVLVMLFIGTIHMSTIALIWLLSDRGEQSSEMKLSS